MTQWHLGSKTKPSGAKKVIPRNKKLYEKGNHPTLTTVVADGGQEEITVAKGMGNVLKLKANKVQHATVLDAEGKSHKMKIETVVLNPANRQFARRNIMTQGAVIQGTVSGKIMQAKVTNRPGQTGQVTGQILEKMIQKEDLTEKKARK
ncbi:MAG: 30S ribosomal protein S8e [Candidatus Diapherotrites archaeon]|nr:30S ribosomal protein S8e [Candidatus Diapherotrites archaeon]